MEDSSLCLKERKVNDEVKRKQKNKFKYFFTCKDVSVFAFRYKKIVLVPKVEEILVLVLYL